MNLMTQFFMRNFKNLQGFSVCRLFFLSVGCKFVLLNSLIIKWTMAFALTQNDVVNLIICF
jgi:hypothetical protein